jgi:hypothetical protein
MLFPQKKKKKTPRYAKTDATKASSQPIRLRQIVQIRWDMK